MAAADLGHVTANERRAYSFPWSRQVFADCLDEGHECWVAIAGGVVVGHGVLAVGAGEAQLLNVCVVPDARGAGHGRSLTSCLIEQASAAGAGRVFLEVRISNRIAMTLYDTLGFEEVGRRRDYYRTEHGREDALIMALDLAAPGP